MRTPMIGSLAGISRLRPIPLVLVAVALGGCAITIRQPANGAMVTPPLMTKVVVTGNASYTGLQVTVDGVDRSSAMVSTGPSSAEGTFNLPGGPHTVSASADVSCWYCAGGTTRSTDAKAFTVLPPCGRPSGAAPVITLLPSLSALAQTPGRQIIAYAALNGRDGLQVIVDDAPGLTRTQMRVELDINPSGGVGWNKAIEAWGFCRGGSRVALVEASMQGGFAEGVICQPVNEVNDWRSGCTNTQTMLLNQSTTSELWLRKPYRFGVWGDVEAIDASMWEAFGGRSVRFIWIAD